MIIHQPEIINKDGRTILWAKIELKNSIKNFPEFIWYRVPERYGSYLSTQSDAFLITCLLAGMNLKEDIEVRGNVSPKLAYSLDEYQFLLNFRKPTQVYPVSIKYENLSKVANNSTGVGSAFSGGLDSLFTIWKHLPENQNYSNFNITHSVFVRGFDILHNENENYQRMYGLFSKELAKYNIDLIPLETNMVSLTHLRLPLRYFHGPFIPSIGLIFSNLFKRFFIPSSADYHVLEHTVHTTDPLLDGFLSTDTIDIIHHGSTDMRVEKAEKIAQWKFAHKILSVCSMEKFEDKKMNCGRCEKCMRTMIPLYAINVLESFETFDKTINNHFDILWYGRHLNFYYKHLGEINLFLKKHKPVLVFWFYLAIIFGYLHYWFIKIIPKPVKRWLNRFGMFIGRNSSWDSYEIHELTNLIKETYDNSST